PLRVAARADALRAPSPRALSRQERADRRPVPRSTRRRGEGDPGIRVRVGKRVGGPSRSEAMTTTENAPQIKLHILRYNPQDPASVPHMQTYELEQTEGMTLFIALTEIQEKQDPSLQFDFVCRAGICGSCAMMVNGRPTLACRTLTRDLGAEFRLAPAPVFELSADLSVNTGKWMRGTSERLEAWLHAKRQDVDLARIEEPMDPDLAEKLNELDRCVECGCCVAAGGPARMREDFVGAVGLAKIGRFRLDPRDRRTDAQYYELVGDDAGVFGCMSLLACHDVCPKNLLLQTQIAFIRRKMVREGLR